jgi:hypothetical protein
MAYESIAAELARLRSEDLQREACQWRVYRRGRVAAATAGRVGCLPADERT